MSAPLTALKACALASTRRPRHARSQKAPPSPSPPPLTVLRRQGRGGEGKGSVRCGRRAAHACGIGQACGRGRCARARAGAGWGARTSNSMSTLPRRPLSRTVRTKRAPEFGARAGTLAPQAVAPGCVLGRLGLLHRLRLLRARAQRPAGPSGRGLAQACPDREDPPSSFRSACWAASCAAPRSRAGSAASSHVRSRGTAVGVRPHLLGMRCSACAARRALLSVRVRRSCPPPRRRHRRRVEC